MRARRYEDTQKKLSVLYIRALTPKDFYFYNRDCQYVLELCHISCYRLKNFFCLFNCESTLDNN